MDLQRGLHGSDGPRNAELIPDDLMRPAGMKSADERRAHRCLEGPDDGAPNVVAHSYVVENGADFLRDLFKKLRGTDHKMPGYFTEDPVETFRRNIWINPFWEDDVNEVVGHVKAIRAKGTGVIGMKIMGEGQFRTPEQRDASIRFVTGLGAVDAMTIGYKSEAEIDEAIERLNTHLNA